MQLARLGDKHHFCYRLDILEIDPGLKSLRIKLELTDPIATDKVSAAATSATGTAAHPAEDTPAVTPVDTAAAAPAETSANIADRVCTRPDLPWREARFGLDFFNFPMLDNTRLPNNYRLALVLSNLDSVVNGAVVTGGAKLKVVIFPEAYASLKDRTFFQDVLDQLVPEANPPAADGTQPATERDREDALGVLRELRDALNRAEAA